MMKHEFERMAGREVTTEQYDAFETLYMNSNLNQQDFVKSIKQILKAIPQPKKEKNIKRMCVRDRSGYRKTQTDVITISNMWNWLTSTSQQGNTSLMHSANRIS